MRGCGRVLHAIHASDLSPSLGEDLVEAHGAAHVVAGTPRPAEQLGIEAQACLRIGGCELVPGEFPGCSRARAAGRWTGRCVEGEGRSLGIRQDRVAADIRDVRGALQHLAAEPLRFHQGGIDAGRANVDQPVRGCARGAIGRQRHQPACLSLARDPQRVGRHPRGLGAPRQDLRVERAGGLRISRHQLVPDESSPNISVAHGEFSPCL